MAFRAPAQSGELRSPPSHRSRAPGTVTAPPQAVPATFQIIVPCFAEGCLRCVVGRPFSQSENPSPDQLHLVLVALEAPERRR